MTKKKATELTKEEALQELQRVDLHPVRKHWLEIAAGLKVQPEGQGNRGKDINARAIPASKTLATRYYEQTGRRLDLEMVKHREMVEIMYQSASEIEDPEARFAALEKATSAMEKFNRQWSPYLEQKLGTLQSTTTLEEKMSLEEALNGEVVDNETPRSE